MLNELKKSSEIGIYENIEIKEILNGFIKV